MGSIVPTRRACATTAPGRNSVTASTALQFMVAPALGGAWKIVRPTPDRQILPFVSARIPTSPAGARRAYDTLALGGRLCRRARPSRRATVPHEPRQPAESGGDDPRTRLGRVVDRQRHGLLRLL